MAIDKNYAYWGIDTFIPFVEAWDTREASKLTDANYVTTEWITKKSNILTKRPSVGAIDDFGFQDRWHELTHYTTDYVVSTEYLPYISSLPIDTWVQIGLLLPLDKRWLKKVVTTNAWAKRPYTEANKIWKEY